MTLTKNPLFPSDSPPDDDAAPQPDRYLLHNKPNRIEPLHSSGQTSSSTESGANPAASLIKAKVDRLYNTMEPDAMREADEAKATPVRSPHQEYMYQLTTSGKSLAEIQTEWHAYYTNLPDDQKHQVWQEFYDANNNGKYYEPSTAARPLSKPELDAKPRADQTAVVSEHLPDEQQPSKPKRSPRSRKEIKSNIRHKVQDRAARIGTKHKQNLHSLLFGLSTGLIVLFIFMFGFFNEVIIAPFIQPGRANATPIIIDNDSIAASGKSEVIIPKINVEIPVIYGLNSNEESTIQNNLEEGVVHYPSTEVPGENGNVAIFGHSSNNIFNKGKYKFAFVLLHELKQDDIFYLTYKKKVYAYKVFTKKIVDPSQIEVLNDIPGETATATLITCDPPGTSLHRLVVVGKQISPNPADNKSSSAGDRSVPEATQIASNGPTMWSRFWNWLF